MTTKSLSELALTPGARMGAVSGTGASSTCSRVGRLPQEVSVRPAPIATEKEQQMRTGVMGVEYTAVTIRGSRVGVRDPLHSLFR